MPGSETPETGPAGPKGDTGAAGDTGATGPAGSSGTTGPMGDTGAKGSTGETGKPGSRGAAGRDAKVTCKVTGARRAQHVACTVKYAGHALARANARLVRDGHTYATGTTARLQARRPVARGHYALRVSAGDSSWNIPVSVR